jgi:phenylacetate-CoA ligase
MSSQQRLAIIDAVEPTVVCCTPTYALRLAEVAAHERKGARPLAESSVRTRVVSGEPGGGNPATRRRIERSWGARVIDHHGLTEVGPISFECWEGPGFLHLNENEYICEVLDRATLAPLLDGQPGELVVTNLGRTASPAIRYRTGDVVVRRSDRCPCGRTLARLEGGILARSDDMVNVRGVNIYPAAIESLVRRHLEVVEFRSTVSQAAALRSLTLEVELVPAAGDAAAIAARIARDLREALGLTIPVHVARPGTLPRFEMKARRFVVET